MGLFGTIGGWIDHTAHKAGHAIEHTAHQVGHAIDQTAHTVGHAITHTWHDAWGWTKEQADRYKNEIENDLENDLRNDAGTVINALGSNALGREALNLINSIHSDKDKFLNWSIGNALEKEFWDINPLEIELINENSLSSAKAPVLSIKPSFQVNNIEFSESIDPSIGHPTFDFNQLSFSDSQKLDFKLGADLAFQIGVDFEIQTYDSGKFYSPVSLSFSPNSNDQKEGEDKEGGSEDGKAQESEGIVSFSAGLGMKAGLTVDPDSENKTYSFSIQQPFKINIDEDAYLSLSERVDAGSLWEAAKTFMSHPFSSGAAERHEISSHNHFSASAGISGDSPEQWLDLGKTKINHPDDITGLSGFLNISPEIGMQVGLILKELGAGVDIGSLNFNINAVNELTFGSEDTYDFSLVGDAGVTGLGLSFGPAHWSAFNENLAKETWNLVDVNLINGQTTSDWSQPTFTSGIKDDVGPHFTSATLKPPSNFQLPSSLKPWLDNGSVFDSQFNDHLQPFHHFQT